MCPWKSCNFCLKHFLVQQIFYSMPSRYETYPVYIHGRRGLGRLISSLGIETRAVDDTGTPARDQISAVQTLIKNRHEYHIETDEVCRGLIKFGKDGRGENTATRSCPG